MDELRRAEAEEVLTNWLRRKKIIGPAELPVVFKFNIMLCGKDKKKAWAMHTRNPEQGIYLVFFRDRSVKDLYILDERCTADSDV